MLNLPLQETLTQANNILIAGAGGGFDLFAGLPLYFNLRAQGKTVYLANLSFSPIQLFDGEMISPTMMKVLPSTKGLEGAYFPEWYLSRWFIESQLEEVPIFAFRDVGVVQLTENYRWLVDQYEIDSIILVDGGTDSLMRGDEDLLGTPAEDLTSIAAVSQIPVPRKLLVCLGFGVDHYHGVSNDLTFSAIADLTQMEAFLGSVSLTEQMSEVQSYRSAAQFVFRSMPNNVSIVSSSILDALAGHYGNHHSTSRTEGSRLWINPLMAIYWFFELDGIVERNILVEDLYDTKRMMQVSTRIVRARTKRVKHVKKRGALPS